MIFIIPCKQFYGNGITTSCSSRWMRGVVMSNNTTSQQTFVLMKTSWRLLKTSFVFIFKRLLQDVLMKTNIFLLIIRLQSTSSRRLAQDQYIRLVQTSSRRLQDVFKTSSRPFVKTSSRCLEDVFKTFLRCLQDFFKRSSRRLADTSSRRLQNVFKRSRKYVLETSSRRFEDVSSS